MDSFIITFAHIFHGPFFFVQFEVIICAVKLILLAMNCSHRPASSKYLYLFSIDTFNEGDEFLVLFLKDVERGIGTIIVVIICTFALSSTISLLVLQNSYFFQTKIYDHCLRDPTLKIPQRFFRSNCPLPYSPHVRGSFAPIIIQY